MNFFKHSFVFLLCSLSSCSNITSKNGPPQQPFSLQTLAKTDIDMVMDSHAQQTFQQLRLLADKLYKRNPSQWKKAGLSSRKAAIARIFKQPFPKVNNTSSTDSIHLAFNKRYQGDRVFAFIAGLGSMLSLAYNGKNDFYLLDSLDAQKIHNSARNIEIAGWLLRSRKMPNGQPYLLSYGQLANGSNQSFERVIGKMIGQQDTLAMIVSQKTDRAIKNVVQSAAQLVFFPI